MGHDDWFRRTTWTAQDEREFEAKLARARGQRTEYLRVQAWTLADTGTKANAAPAIALANRLLAETAPDHPNTEMILLTLARSQITLGSLDAATDAYRRAVEAEHGRTRHSVRAYMEFAWFAASRRLTGLYDEVLSVVERDADPRDLVFPAWQYQYYGALALIAADRGQRELARDMAHEACKAADQTHGPFSRHPTVGLVRRVPRKIQKRIAKLAM